MIHKICLHDFELVSIQPFIEEILFGNAKVELSSRILNYEPIDQLPYLFPEGHVKSRHPSSSLVNLPFRSLPACIHPASSKECICAARTECPYSYRYLGYPVVLKEKRNSSTPLFCVVLLLKS